MDKLISKLASNIIFETDDKEIIEYGIFVIAFNGLCIGITLIIGLLLGEFKFTIKLMILFTPVRILLGGYHCNHPVSCLVLFNSISASLILLYKLHILERFAYFNLAILFFFIAHSIKYENKNKNHFIPLLLLFLVLLIKVINQSSAVAYSLTFNNVFCLISFFRQELFTEL